MFKAKLAIFLAAATLSLSASAGFIQYNVWPIRFSDGNFLEGFFIQNTDNKAIVYYDLTVSGFPVPGEDIIMHYAEFSPFTNNIVSASTYFPGAGPTNFAVVNDVHLMYYFLNLEFGSTTTAGLYRVFGSNHQRPLDPDNDMGLVSGSRTIVSGFAFPGDVSENLLELLENGPIPGLNHIVPRLTNDPRQVPEPGSLALLMLGVAGLLGMRRQMRPPTSAPFVDGFYINLHKIYLPPAKLLKIIK